MGVEHDGEEVDEPRTEVEEVVDDTDYAGTRLTVTWGREHIQPIQFQGMDVGPFAMEVVIQEGETPLDAKRRAMAHLEAMAQADLDDKLPGFFERVTRAGRAARYG